MLRNKTNEYTHIYVLSRRTKEGEAPDTHTVYKSNSNEIIGGWAHAKREGERERVSSALLNIIPYLKQTHS